MMNFLCFFGGFGFVLTLLAAFDGKTDIALMSGAFTILVWFMVWEKNKQTKEEASRDRLLKELLDELRKK